MIQPDGEIVLIHIGKSGGSTVKVTLEDRFPELKIKWEHVTRPVFDPAETYYISLRNPFSRLISAFNWRYKLVVEDGDQRDRFVGEYDVLRAHGSFNHLAEALYDANGRDNPEAQAGARKIHHIGESISYYLDDFLDTADPGNIGGVIRLEHMGADMARLFEIHDFESRKDIVHPNRKSHYDYSLSERGRRNTLRFFRNDFSALAKLLCLGLIDRDYFMSCLDYPE